MLSESAQEAVQLREDIVGVTAINEAFPIVMDKPAVDIWTSFLVTPVVLLPAPDWYTDYKTLKYDLC